MIPVVPEKRRDGRSSFLQLVSYVSLRDDITLDTPISADAPVMRPSRSKEAIFDRLVDYIDRNAAPENQVVIAEFPDGRQQVRSGHVVCETNCFTLATAAAEMNMVAAQNTRCIEPVYHFILSWQEQEAPRDEDIFDCARESLNSLGMQTHQYVTAIHRDTDNVHCHVAANRINPISYRATNLYNDIDRLHKVCRRLELKYGYAPDNGAWINENGNIVRSKNDLKSIPSKARKREHHNDLESLYTYAVDECRDRIGLILGSGKATWEKLHAELIRAGLELKPKGEGLAIYSRHDASVTPIKSSALHPDLTRQCLEPWLGEFTPSPEVINRFNDNGVYLGSNYEQEFVYDARTHVRDMTARSERRVARAEARENLDARYRAYKAAWIRPKMDDDRIRLRYKALSNRYSWQKAQVRKVFDDPLVRKLVYQTLDVERQAEFDALSQQVRQERRAFYSAPENRSLNYWQWVEQQAAKQDQAAISRLRGRAYKVKRQERTAALSENAILCSVADDIPAVNVQGFDLRVNRDGAIQYLQAGRVVLQDTGESIEIADPYCENGIHIADAMLVAEEKCGETLLFTGQPEFVKSACHMVPWFNEGSDKPLWVTEPRQRVQRNNDKPAETPAVASPGAQNRGMDEAFWRQLYGQEIKNRAVDTERPEHKPKVNKNTWRPH
ncbi:TraI/MobA(P) family conjugative relaxase [Sodalis endosymbiont of Spalangia cameroni]|uniref:TraI/MobA(P) family conjugative relaxase n=1 Tax=Sodalis praecaptivus TaxID=1239307 RepID=UPI0031F86AE7